MIELARRAVFTPRLDAHEAWCVYSDHCLEQGEALDDIWARIVRESKPVLWKEEGEFYVEVTQIRDVTSSRGSLYRCVDFHLVDGEQFYSALERIRPASYYRPGPTMLSRAVISLGIYAIRSVKVQTKRNTEFLHVQWVKQ
jgi:hypothetical protein